MSNGFPVDDDDVEKTELLVYGVHPGGSRWFTAQVLSGATGKSMKECDKIVETLQKNETHTFNLPIEGIELIKADLKSYGFLLEKPAPIQADAIVNE